MACGCGTWLVLRGVLVRTLMAGTVLGCGGRPGRLVTAVVPRLDQGPAHSRHGQEQQQGNQSGTAEHSQHEA